MEQHNSLYSQLLGADFNAMASELQTLHGTVGKIRFAGRCTVTGAATLAGKLIGRILALPKTTKEADFSFELEANSAKESWRRYFPGRLMTSHMQIVDGKLVERLGPVELCFTLQANGSWLTMQLCGIRVCGISLPQFLVPSIDAKENASPGKLHFDVVVRMPIVGLLAAYHGFLDTESIEHIA